MDLAYHRVLGSVVAWRVQRREHGEGTSLSLLIPVSALVDRSLCEECVDQPQY